jgi:GntR family transcriptional regulator
MPHKPGKLFIPPPSPAAPGPLYQQIVEAIRREIAEGRLPSGAPLPSFRVLAKDMLVSLITVKRAYEELEREGLLVRRQGLGTFVAPGGGDKSRRDKRRNTIELLKAALIEAEQAGLSEREILKLMRELIQNKEVQDNEQSSD